jgi:hypothetical protein
MEIPDLQATSEHKCPGGFAASVLVAPTPKDIMAAVRTIATLRTEARILNFAYAE